MKASHLFAFAMIAVLPALVFAQSELHNGFSPPETISIGDTMVLQVPAGASTESIQRWLDRAVDQSSGNHTVRLEFAEHPVHAIFLRDVSDVRVIGNEFIPSTEMAAGVYAIKLDDFRDVRLKNNSFWNWPGGPERAVLKTGESENKLDSEPWRSEKGARSILKHRVHSVPEP